MHEQDRTTLMLALGYASRYYQDQRERAISIGDEYMYELWEQRIVLLGIAYEAVFLKKD